MVVTVHPADSAEKIWSGSFLSLRPVNEGKQRLCAPILLFSLLLQLLIFSTRRLLRTCPKFCFSFILCVCACGRAECRVVMTVHPANAAEKNSVGFYIFFEACECERATSVCSVLFLVLFFCFCFWNFSVLYDIFSTLGCRSGRDRLRRRRSGGCLGDGPHGWLLRSRDFQHDGGRNGNGLVC